MPDENSKNYLKARKMSNCLGFWPKVGNRILWPAFSAVWAAKKAAFHSNKSADSKTD